MEQSNNSSNSATVGGEPNDIDSECERVLLETMKFHDMPYHASSAPVHSLSEFLERQPSYLEATRPTSQAAAASAAIPSVYYPHPYIGTGTDTGTDVGGGLLVHNHLGMEPTNYEGSEPASSLTFQNIPTSSTTSKDNIIQLPHSNDVLCGRGGNINAHPGNLIFRDWVAERKESYQLAKTKMEKSKITCEIFYRVQNQAPPGRFLQKIAERDGKSKSNPYSLSGLWVEIEHTKALAKVSQALREGAPEFRAKLEERAVLLHGKRKEPPSEPQSIERMPARATQVAGSMPPRSTDKKNDRGSVGVNMLPQVSVGHHAAPVDESDQAIPPRTMKKLTSGVPREGQIPGEWSYPELLPTTNIPSFVSPGVSPYAAAKLALDTMSLSPNLYPTPVTQPPPEKRASLNRGHSLSSDGDIHSVGSFDDPFASENGSNHIRER